MEAEATIVGIQAGYGKSLPWITVEWTDETGSARKDNFPCRSRYNVGDTVRVIKIRLIGWQLHPDYR